MLTLCDLRLCYLLFPIHNALALFPFKFDRKNLHLTTQKSHQKLAVFSVGLVNSWCHNLYVILRFVLLIKEGQPWTSFGLHLVTTVGFTTATLWAYHLYIRNPAMAACVFNLCTNSFKCIKARLLIFHNAIH